MRDRPHILFLLTDQQRADGLGCAGHPALKTPHLDALAATGTRFTNCFTNCPLCVPARMALATGQYPHNTGLWQNDVELPADAVTYFSLLRDHGYRTATIGKNHLFEMENCDLYANTPRYQAAGFDDVEDLSGTWGLIGGRSVYTDYLAEYGRLEPVRDYLRQLEGQPDETRRFVAEPLPIPAEAYIDAFIARRVERYIESYSYEQPSFLFVGFQGPHEPWDAPQTYVDRVDVAGFPAPIEELPQGDWLPESSRRYHRWAQYYPPPSRQVLQAIAARYYGKIAQIDDAVGQILSAYERKGWLDKTLVIFASDHGEMLGDHNRLSKSVFYESALRVPLIIRLPTNEQPMAHECRAHVELFDIHATILEMAGVRRVDHCDAVSLYPFLHESVGTPSRDILSEVHAHFMLRAQAWKIVVGRYGETLALFDLAHDPHEQRNLCGHPNHGPAELKLRSRLLRKLAGSMRRLGRADPEFSGHAFPDVTS